MATLLTPDEQRLAIRFLYPTTGFMVGNDGTLLKWKHPTDPPPEEKDIEKAYDDYLKEIQKEGVKKSEARNAIASADMKEYSKSVAKCEQFLAADPQGTAKILYWLANYIVSQANDIKFSKKDFLD